MSTTDEPAIPTTEIVFIVIGAMGLCFQSIGIVVAVLMACCKEKEIYCYKTPTVRTEVQPSSISNIRVDMSKDYRTKNEIHCCIRWPTDRDSVDMEAGERPTQSDQIWAEQVRTEGEGDPSSQPLLPSDSSVQTDSTTQSSADNIEPEGAEQVRTEGEGDHTVINTSSLPSLPSDSSVQTDSTTQSPADNIEPEWAEQVTSDDVESERYRQVSITSPDSGSFSNSNSDFENEFAKYKHEMPPELQIGYFDCLILYCDEDRECVERFCDHLINDIELENYGPVRAVLYDGPELITLAQSKLKSLAMGVERCTYVFIYLTEKFVDDAWNELASESCLMNSIDDKKKQWSVVPVYTEKKAGCRFKIPMGLNSLKGIDYYTNDSFYRKGVARLIEGNIAKRVEKEKWHRRLQKTWIEENKPLDAIRGYPSDDG